MAFKMKGFPLRSGFKQITEEEKIEIAKNQDPGSGRNKADEIHFDIMESYDEEKRLQEEYQAVGKRLRSSFLPEQEALRKIWSNLSPLSFLSGVDSEGGGLLDYDLVKARIGQAKKDINNIEPVPI